MLEEAILGEKASLKKYNHVLGEIALPSSTEMVLDSPSEEIKLARKLLLKISVTYKTKQAEVIVDGTSFKASFLLIEIMNIQFISPNLKLAPHADPSDGYLEMVMLHEEDRGEFVTYLEELATRYFTQRNVNLIAVSCDREERAKKTGDEWDIPGLPGGYALPTETARDWGLYISKCPRMKRTNFQNRACLWSDRTIHFMPVQFRPCLLRGPIGTIFWKPLILWTRRSTRQGRGIN